MGVASGVEHPATATARDHYLPQVLDNMAGGQFVLTGKAIAYL